MIARLSLFEYFCNCGCLWSRIFRKPTPIEVPFKLLLFDAYVPWWLKWFNQYMEVFASFCFQSTVFSSLRLWFSVDMVVGIRLASRFERFVLVWKIWRVQILVAYSVVGSLRTNFGNSDFTWRKVDGGVWYSRISILDLVWNFRCRNWHVRKIALPLRFINYWKHQTNIFRNLLRFFFSLFAFFLFRELKVFRGNRLPTDRVNIRVCFWRQFWRTAVTPTSRENNMLTTFVPSVLLVLD